MWIITNKGLISSVQDREDKDLLIVRARQEGLLEDLLSQASIVAEVWTDETADYPYRVKLSKILFTDLVFEQIQRIDYPNFKNSIQNDRFHSLCSQVWTVFSNLGFGKLYGKRGLGIDEDLPRGARRGYRAYERRTPLTVKDLSTLPREAFLEDGRLNPDYIGEA